MANKEKKVYTYKHSCPNCHQQLRMTFDYSHQVKKSIGYCLACDHPAIVGKASNYSTNTVYKKENK